MYNMSYLTVLKMINHTPGQVLHGSFTRDGQPFQWTVVPHSNGGILITAPFFYLMQVYTALWDGTLSDGIILQPLKPPPFHIYSCYTAMRTVSKDYSHWAKRIPSLRLWKNCSMSRNAYSGLQTDIPTFLAQENIGSFGLPFYHDYKWWKKNVNTDCFYKIPKWLLATVAGWPILGSRNRHCHSPLHPGKDNSEISKHFWASFSYSISWTHRHRKATAAVFRGPPPALQCRTFSADSMALEGSLLSGLLQTVFR